MKTIHVIFDDDEYKDIKKAKKDSKKSWHDFLLDVILNANNE